MKINENNRPYTESQNAIKKEAEVEIYVQESITRGKNGFIWAFKESYEKNVFGWAESLNEVKRRAKKMFPEKNINLKFF